MHQLPQNLNIAQLLFLSRCRSALLILQYKACTKKLAADFEAKNNSAILVRHRHVLQPNMPYLSTSWKISRSVLSRLGFI